ncbi:MAG TPA: TlpA disulfide reductase family protein, partial [Pirellulales bacterium]|nr:TlpA disulfide reductase family protein [Pirellulales bacterium]
MSARFSRVLLTALCVAASAVAWDAACAAEKDGKAGKVSGSPYDVPDGTPQELLAFIKKVQKLPSTATTRKERMDHLRNVCQAVVTAAERIVDAKVDDETAVAAVRAELEALTMLKRLSDKDASEKLEALTDKLKNDKRPAVAQILKVQTLQQKMEKLDPSDSEAVNGFVTDVKDLLHSAPPDVQFLPLAQTAMMALFKSGQQDEAAEFGQDFGKLFAESDNPDVVAGSIQLIAPAGQVLGMRGKPDEAAKLFRKYLDDFAKRDELQLQIATSQLAQVAGQNLQSAGKDREAAKLYADIAARLADSADPSVQQAAEQLAASARKLELVGQPMAISGKLVGGGQFDIAQYKGKVVLVDFWATWCGPCIAELPNVKDTYDKFHDRGFEVVGISLDNEIDALTKFIADRQIPWPILFEGGEETSGWSHPLAKKYGVNAIPMAVLLNREGKVVTLSARGETLGELVAELLGVNESDDAGAGSKEEKKAG